jgi:hypothetical protein
MVTLRHKVKTGTEAKALVQVGNRLHVCLTFFRFDVVSDHEGKPMSMWPKVFEEQRLLPCDDEELSHHFPLKANIPILDWPA